MNYQKMMSQSAGKRDSIRMLEMAVNDAFSRALDKKLDYAFNLCDSQDLIDAESELIRCQKELTDAILKFQKVNYEIRAMKFSPNFLI
jgi:hypothetical protein